MLNTSKSLVAGSLFWIGVAPFVQSELKTFQPGDVIKSSEMNGNFEYLEGQIEDLGIELLTETSLILSLGLAV